MIDNEKRAFNMEYAEAEWQWYLSGDPNVDKLGEIYGKVPQYGNVWQMLMVKLILITVGNGKEIIS